MLSNIKIKDMVIVLDYDRTLVNDDKQILPKTKEILLELQRKKATLVIATGRPVKGVERICTELNMHENNGFVIGCNGAEIYDCKNKMSLKQNYIDKNTATKIRGELAHLNICIGIFSNEYIVANYENSDMLDEASSNNLFFDSYNQSINNNSPKIVLSDTRDTIHGYYDVVCSSISSDVNIVRSSPRYIEITSADASKVAGLKYLLEKIKKNQKNTVAFGDSDNDIEVLKYVKYGVIMDNATSEIKKTCNYLTKSNNEEGIYVFLQRNVRYED